MTENRNGTVITFYSYKGGTGRTMTLANVAWILAANGHRVLAVDWDLEAPGLHKFFHPFLNPAMLRATPGLSNLIDDYRRQALRDLPDRAPDWHRRHARVRPHALSLDWTFPEGGSLDFLSAGRRHDDYPLVGNMDWDRFYASYGGGQFFEAMRADMRRHYDYTLIDSRTGLSDLADICTVQMPNTLVVCYTLSGQSIEGAAAVAQDIRERFAHKGIRILPLAMRIDLGEKDKLDAGRALAKERFDGLPTGLDAERRADYWASMEVLYQPYYAYEEILAAFGDPPKTANSMLSACERITSVITEGRVTGLPSIGEEKRARYKAAYTRRRPLPVSRLVLYHVSEDRMWVDWLEAVLRGAGFEVVPMDVRALPQDVDSIPRYDAEDGAGGEESADSSERLLAVASPAFLNSRRARRAWDDAVRAGGRKPRNRPVAVRVDDVRLSLPQSGRGAIDLSRLDEERAYTALLTGLDHPDVPPAPPGDGARFPNTGTRISNVQPRYPWFTGRSPILDRLRERLVSGRAGQRLPQVLHGLGGVGKSQLAREYAHRFKADYDLVWWIDAEQPDLVLPKVAALAQELDLPVGDDVAEAAEAAMTALRHGDPCERWLLIFDNVPDLDKAIHLFPGHTAPLPDHVYGHILVTTRARPASTLVQSLEMEVFTREESVEHLCRRVPGLREDDADRVADALGDLPLAVEVAAAWLEATATPVHEYIEQLREQSTRVLSVQEAVDAVEYPSSVGATWNISIARLREESPAAARLLELCAFFAAEPISMSLISSDAMIEALLPYDRDLRARYMLGRVTQALNRFALAKVDSADNSIQVHRLVQAAVRDGLDDQQYMKTMHEVHQILAAARPSEGAVDDPAQWHALEVIWPHLTPSNIRECPQEGPRELMVDRVRYLGKRGELHAARTLATQLDELWTNALGDRDDEQILNLRFQLANVLRAQGDYQAAVAMDESTRDGRRRLFGEGHPSILIASGSVAADYRALGRFKEALELDTRIHQGFAEVFGEDHPRTLFAANNLAIDLRLAGDSEAARRLDEDTVRRRTALLGPTHPYTLATKALHARDLRDLGDYRTSAELLREVREGFEQVFNPGVPEVLQADKSLAVSLRKAGRTAEALRITEETWQTYARFHDRYGSTIPEVLACGLNLAADYFATDLENGAARAVRQVEEVLGGYRDSFGTEHPFTMYCLNNLAMYSRALGDAEKAAELSGQARDALAASLGDDHPAVQSAGLNLANACADLGDHDRAEHWERQAVESLRRRFGADHPDVLVGTANLAITLRDTGRQEESVRLQGEAATRLSQLLGSAHSVTASVRGWRRVGRDLEPHQI
ncbi:FxSxx-COOH system tetratricopeptide repeat protein [Streptomyces ipomoeae]|uniref:Tetratricopeptide repeat protein n=1 Tax=Streptomyces ipomoeae 91-03 TaxID=698759 RepID=L1KSJ4_9ACTN|nr:FxSxx-COOH system tetratricopeptide repeat protein [Streptomyces ipomoeae]EKX63529.1 tetratricopeptide repeat protein [Streptomyces ipomoeae 91-03]MDX2838634.1 FxSxx-COOH system tetratricopeptide repeat protein [Streptomyces ipomoeae]